MRSRASKFVKSYCRYAAGSRRNIHNETRSFGSRGSKSWNKSRTSKFRTMNSPSSGLKTISFLVRTSGLRE